MTRNKLILYIALVLAIVLVVAFASQVRKLQKQFRSTVRIIPSESKSRNDIDQNGANRDAVSALGRPEVLVKFRAGVTAATINEIATRYNDQLHDEIEVVPGLTSIDDRDNADALAVVAQYATLNEVEYAEPNYEIAVDEAVDSENASRLTDPRFHEQWGLNKIHAPEAWRTTKGSGDIVVAVLDTGVEYTHVDLANNIWTRPAGMALYHDKDLGTVDDLHGYNAVANDGDPLDENGHGTAVAGIVGAECGNNIGICGVNWRVRIMPLKFMSGGGFGDVYGAIESINYAIDRKRAGVNLRVINASWGFAQPSRALEEVIRKAYEAGILFIVASGNTSENSDASSHYPAGYSIGNIISVAASDSNDSLTRFSNYGLKGVHVAAPGQDILTTVLGNDYEQRSGSSMAAPFLAGVAALALSTHPDLSVGQLRAWLLEAVDQVPALHGKVSTGGRLNAAKAVGGK
jgi:subtilisin family serine protease